MSCGIWHHKEAMSKRLQGAMFRPLLEPVAMLIGLSSLAFFAEQSRSQ